MLNHFLSLLAFVSSITVFAQDYFQKKYDVRDGLPTDIIKATAQDRNGYFWIATDEGLARYDGISFTNYVDILHSNYLKGFLTKRDGDLILIGDQDFLLIDVSTSTPKFKSIVDVSKVETDTTLLYPKTAYEDQQGTIWVSEPQAVVRITDTGIKRYSFGVEDRTTQFLRSFDFFEDQNGDLYTTSFHGNVYKYNESTDTFEKTNFQLPAEIEYIGVFDNLLVIGATSGLYTLKLSDNGDFASPKHIEGITEVSHIESINEEEYFIATRGDTHYLGNIKDEKFRSFPYSINNINQLYKSAEQDLWLSSNEGWVLTRKNIFSNPIPSLSQFIEAVVEDVVTAAIYYATKRHLFVFDPTTQQSKVIMETQDGYFQSLISTEEGLWIANAFDVSLYKDGEIIVSYNFSDGGRFISSMSKDHSGNIWLTIPGTSEINRIDTNHHLIKHKIVLEDDHEISQIKEGPDGIYATASGKNSYLYFKAEDSSDFKNISPKLDFVEGHRFECTGLAFNQSGNWLASSEGLLQFDKNSTHKVSLNNEFDQFPIRSVIPFDDDRLIMANAIGLLVYSSATGVTDIFNENDGLPSRAVIPKTTFVTSDGTIWAGTSHGIAYTSTSLTNTTKTNTPKFISAIIDGKVTTSLQENTIQYGDLVTINISSITFPEQNITYQYRLTPAEGWRTTPQEIVLSNLSGGKHILEVRAKKFGPYSWSDILVIPFQPSQPFYKRASFLLLVLLTVIIIIMITYAIVTKRNKAQQQLLTNLINKKTSELQQTNKHLETLNKERNSLIQIMAHDLKNPIGQIINLSDLIKYDGEYNDETKKYLDFITQISFKMSGMIERVLQLNQLESKEKTVKKERINLSEMIEGIIKQMKAQADAKEITFIKQISSSISCNTDYFLTVQIFENLISNAIKFSFPGNSITVNVKESGGYAICEIQDGGPGLTADDMKKLFGKFQRLSATPTGDEPSTGLGLSIVKKLTEILNARINVTSEEGKGACFTVSIPLA